VFAYVEGGRGRRGDERKEEQGRQMEKVRRKRERG
jgi:hypothetical protein